MTDTESKQKVDPPESPFSRAGIIENLLKPSPEIKETARAIALPNTTLWVMSESVRNNIKNDGESKIFNEQFARDVWSLMQDYSKRVNTLLRIVWVISFLILSLMWQYEFPFSLPYLESTDSFGLLDISVVLFFFLNAKKAELATRTKLCETVLRVYCEERYGEDERSVLSLRWGIDFLYKDVTSADYMGRDLKRPWRAIHLILWLPVIFGSLISLIIMISVALWGMLHVLVQPSFGIASILLVLVAFGIFVSHTLISLQLIIPGIHSSQETDEQ